MTSLVDVQNLSIAYGSATGAVTVVHNVSFSVQPGQCVALVGESGSGKSTIARSLIGLAGATATVDADILTIDGLDTRGFSDKQWRGIRGTTAGLVLQDALVSLDPLRTIGQEVSEARRVGEKSGENPRMRTSRADRAAAVNTLLADVGLDHPERRARQHAHQLSGGQRQRALIATAIAGQPDLIIADEPTTALDSTVQRQVLDLLRAQMAIGRGVLLVSHDLAVVAEIADHVIVLRHGRVVEQGTPEQILHNPAAEYTRQLVDAIPHPDQKSPTRTSERAPVLAARGIGVHYRIPGGSRTDVHVALTDVDVDVTPGRVLGIVGESGSGKSSLLRVLLATQEPQAGTVTLDGEPWSGIPEKQRRARRPRVQIVSQDPLSSFDPRYSVRQILGEALRRTVPSASLATECERLLESVGLDVALLDRHPLDLSGGQRQRVAIARALGAQPEVLLCDEAVSALDVLVQAQILALLDDIRRERGVAIVFVSHDLGVVYEVSDDVIVLKDGRIVEAGPVRDVYDAPQHEYTRQLLGALPKALRE